MPGEVVRGDAFVVKFRNFVKLASSVAEGGYVESDDFECFGHRLLLKIRYPKVDNEHVGVYIHQSLDKSRGNIAFSGLLCLSSASRANQLPPTTVRIYLHHIGAGNGGRMSFSRGRQLQTKALLWMGL